MIQLIGIIIGLYVITRMVDLLAGRQANGQAYPLVMGTASLTLIVTILCTLGLFMTGAPK